MANNFNLTLDTTGPGGAAVSINAGAAYATSRDVSVAATTTDGDTTGYQMKIWGDVDGANDESVQPTEGASLWILYDPDYPVRLSAGDGVKTINVKIRDDVLNSTTTLSDTITLDTTLPVPDITVAASPTKISKQATADTCTFSFQSDVAIQAWKVKVVPAANSLHNAGTTIPVAGGSQNTTGGALAATTNQGVTIKGADLESASAGDGTKIVKVFVQDLAGNWSV